MSEVPEVDRRRALLVDEESSESGNATRQRDRIVGLALLHRDANSIDLVGWKVWPGDIVGAAREKHASGSQGHNQNAMEQHARLVAVEC